jgi:hypothetical protein
VVVGEADKTKRSTGNIGMIKRILVGLAGTIYTPVAIERAVTLAKEHDAEVTGVTVLDPRRLRLVEQLAQTPRGGSTGQKGPPVPISPDFVGWAVPTKHGGVGMVSGSSLVGTAHPTQDYLARTTRSELWPRETLEDTAARMIRRSVNRSSGEFPRKNRGKFPDFRAHFIDRHDTTLCWQSDSIAAPTGPRKFWNEPMHN